MKIIVIALNICQLFLVFYLMQKKRLPIDAEGMSVFLLIATLPVINLWYIYSTKHPPSETMSSIYAKRKALEDKLGIADIQKKE
jgi:hypothetical protein